jgi:hypothetical protein
LAQYNTYSKTSYTHFLEMGVGYLFSHEKVVKKFGFFDVVRQIPSLLVS